MPYSTRLYAGSFATGSPTLYTVPEGFVAVLRDIRLYGALSATAEVALEVTVPGPLTTIIYFESSFAAGQYVEWSGRVVLEAGDELVGVTTEDSITAHVSGYLLSSP